MATGRRPWQTEPTTEAIPPVPPTTARLLFLTANLATWAALLAALHHGLGPAWPDVVITICAALFAPWSVLGLTNGTLGLILLFARTRRERGAAPIALRTAIVMTIRNEDPIRALARLWIVQQSTRHRYDCHVLSDTDDPAIAEQEEAAIAAWTGAPPPRYRRRTRNNGYKAGNVMAFCETQGRNYDLMLLLDADSLMSGPAIDRLVRMMQDNPRLGIVQSLVTGLPSPSPFARIFQFGMRHGMRSYTVGQDAWAQDCGPFWGHNAIVRIAPFREHCQLPALPSGHILSHDQIEAVLIRRAGWEVRLQPIAGGSWEDNPPTLLDYVRRDLRWCQGNLQYLRLLRMPGLLPVSRFQLIWAVLMFAGLPAWTLAIALLPFASAADPAALKAAWAAFLLMFLWPKLAAYAHTAASRRRRARYGGLARFLAGIAVETGFSLLQSAVTSFHATGFIAALALGRQAAWAGQARDPRPVTWREAAAAFWPQTLFGIALHAAILLESPGLLGYALPFTLGYPLAIPFAVLTASPGTGRWCVRHGLCAIPEETAPPPEVRACRAATG
jgi:membrane glycosyltransferase